MKIRVSYSNQPMLASQQLQLYTEAMHAKGAPLESCFSLISGTVYHIARPRSNGESTMGIKGYTD